MPPKLRPDRLLAKSVEGRWRGSYSLVGHTGDVVSAVTTLVDTLGIRLLQQFGLKGDLAHLRATARLAAYLHDWGKANNHFQGVVRQRMEDASPKRNALIQPQLIRHEIASLLLAWEFRDWLRQADGDFETALVAAGGHHLKLGGKGGQRIDYIDDSIVRPCGDASLSLYLGHVDFKGLLRFGIKQLGCPSRVILPHKPPTEWTVGDIKKTLSHLLLEEFSRFTLDPVFTAVCKALVICGDSIASAAPAADIQMVHWIRDEVERTLDEAKTQVIVEERLKGNQLRPFQRDLASSPTRVTLARAGCGTGKTLGAYAWAKKHANGRKLFFCYPTTGTSTEGFIDYVHGKADSALLHSRSEVDLARWEEDQKKRELKSLYTTGEEEAVEDTRDNEIAQKLDSFKAWGREVNVCTVDTVLGMLQCNRRALYCFPAIATAAFVFDEVHCYDERLFGALLRFLETVKAPVLLMSASFLPWQRQAIEDAVGEEISSILGPEELEAQSRYRFHYRQAPDWERVEQELAAGGRVLWVCNQVNTAIDVYRQAQQRQLNAVVYHSRFRYQDRVKRHRDVVDGFGEGKGPVLAIATQVAEMSLDLSATLLVTQIADPAGLIQRLGRLNRRYCGHALDAIFYPDEKRGYPYSQEDLENGERLIQSFTGDVNQAQLAAWLENTQPEESPACQTVLLDGAWRTYAASLREAGHNVTAILEQDLNTVRDLPGRKLPLYTLPLPAGEARKWEERHKFYPIAPAEEWGYSSELGAFKHMQEGN